MKKLYTSLLALACTILITTSATAKDVKIAVIDMQKVVTGTKSFTEGSEKFKAEGEKLNKEIKERESVLQRRQEELKGKQGVLSEEKMLEESNNWRKDFRSFQADVQLMNETFGRKRAKLMDEIVENVRKEVENISKEKGYELVLDKAAYVVYSADYVDISDAILARVNK